MVSNLNTEQSIRELDIYELRIWLWHLQVQLQGNSKAKQQHTAQLFDKSIIVRRDATHK